MSQRLRFQLSSISVEEESENLKHLLTNYINRSEELENKESQVMKQVELMHSALRSLQTYSKENQMKMFLTPERRSIEEIEEETQRIREETEQIRMEVKEKMALNKELQEHVNRRKMLRAGSIDEFFTEPYVQDIGQETKLQKPERVEIETGTPPLIETDLDRDPGLAFFSKKLKKLQEMEKRVKQESADEEAQSRKKRRELKEKLKLLEWESEADRQLLQSLKKKTESS